MADPTFDLVIAGAGAAGLYCAAEAGKRGLRVIVLEHQAAVGRKIRISGGGRCNFTNRSVTSENFVSRNPRFCASALARHTPEDFISLVRRHRIPFHEKKDGQLFCDGSAQQIIDMLLDECRDAGVGIMTSCSIAEVSRPDEFRIDTSSGPLYGKRLVVATGGLSIPALGATDIGYRIARRFNLSLVPPVPALVPFLWNDEDRSHYASLAGVSCPVRITCRKQRFEDDALFTHRGISGPAILQISNYWDEGDALTIDLLPGISFAGLLDAHRREPLTLATLVSRVLPRRLVQGILDDATASTPLHQCSRKMAQALGDRLHSWHMRPAGTEGFTKAEVTRGGVDTRALSSRTMEATGIPGLFFIGEVVDVTGWLGGYNFQWAWSSAMAAASSMTPSC